MPDSISKRAAEDRYREWVTNPLLKFFSNNMKKSGMHPTIKGAVKDAGLVLQPL